MSLRELYAEQTGVCDGLPLADPHLSSAPVTCYFYTIAIMAGRFSWPEGGFWWTVPNMWCRQMDRPSFCCYTPCRLPTVGADQGDFHVAVMSRQASKMVLNMRSNQFCLNSEHAPNRKPQRAACQGRIRYEKPCPVARVFSRFYSCYNSACDSMIRMR